MKKLIQLCAMVIMLTLLNVFLPNNATARAAIHTTATDTTVVSTMADDTTDAHQQEETVSFTYVNGSMDDPEIAVNEIIDKATTAIIGPLVGGVVCMILITIIIIFIIWIRYKHQREKMKLISEAIAAGRPLPNEFTTGTEYLRSKQMNRSDDIYRNLMWEKGVRNVCMGTALTIFFYLLTDALSLAAVGLIIVGKGVSQILIARGRKNTTYNTPDNAPDRSEEK